MNSTSLVLADVRLTADDFVAVNFRLWRVRPRIRLSAWLLGTAGLLLVGSLGLELAQTGAVQDWSTVALLGVALGYGAFRVGLVRYQLRRGYAQDPAGQEPITFTLTNQGLRGQSTLGNFFREWAGVRRAVWVGSRWLLLYPTETACYYLDLNRLRAPATAADVAYLLTQHQIRQQRV